MDAQTPRRLSGLGAGGRPTILRDAPCPAQPKAARMLAERVPAGRRLCRTAPAAGCDGDPAAARDRQIWRHLLARLGRPPSGPRTATEQAVELRTPRPLLRRLETVEPQGAGRAGDRVAASMSRPLRAGHRPCVVWPARGPDISGCRAMGGHAHGLWMAAFFPEAAAGGCFPRPGRQGRACGHIRTMRPSRPDRRAAPRAG